MSPVDLEHKFSGYASGTNPNPFQFLSDIFGTNDVNTDPVFYPIVKARTYKQLSATTLTAIPPNELLVVQLMKGNAPQASLNLPGGTLGVPAGTVFGPLVFSVSYVPGDTYDVRIVPSAGIAALHGLSATLTT